LLPGCWLLRKLRKSFPISDTPIPVNYLLFLASDFWIDLGARLYHVIDYWQYYSKNPIEIFIYGKGEWGIYGAIAGGFVSLWVLR